MEGIFPVNSSYYVDSLRIIGDALVKDLTDYCPKIKELILEEKISQYYSIYGSEQAIKSYKGGKLALELEEYSIAEKYFLEAMNANPGWVLPLDYLGMISGIKKDYNNAILYYSKSLEIFPEGSFALMKQAAVFTKIHEYEKALKNYKAMIRHYPKDIEGYFGLGQVYYLLENYEIALDNLMYCHKKYVAENSDYVKDTQYYISSIHGKLKEQNKLHIYDRLSNKYKLILQL